MNRVSTKWNKCRWDLVDSTNIHVCGAAFYRDELLRGSLLANLFKLVKTEPDSWVNILSQCNGFFTIASQTTDATIVAVDRVRSTPVFYGQKDGSFFISDDAEWVRQRVGDSEMEPLAYEEFQLAGYVTGQDTLYPNVKQLQAGEILYIKHEARLQLTTHRWYCFTHNNPTQGEEILLGETLDHCVEASMQRLVQYASGRQIVIPLSGGYDSRLIALILKRIGYENVLTFTYGVPGNKEAEFSRRVAAALGYKWHFVTYTADKWRSAWRTHEAAEYRRMAANHTSLPHVQDWLAVKELVEKGVIDHDAVMVPGHSGDFVAGSHIPSFVFENESFTEKQLYESLIKDHLSNINKQGMVLSDLEKMCDRLNSRIGASLDGTPESFANLYEFWDWQERQAKYIVNSVRVYDQFKLDWWLPLWDSEFTGFWQSVPLSIRRGRSWYNNWILEKYKELVSLDDTSVHLRNASDLALWKIVVKKMLLFFPSPVLVRIKEIVKRRAVNKHFLAFEGLYNTDDLDKSLKEDSSIVGIFSKLYLEDRW